MKKVKTIVLRTAGTNCDRETAFAFERAGSQADMVHINELVGKKKFLADYHILAVPGGFTYGDDIASGKILANEIKSKLKKEITSFVGEGKLAIGICNGFQVLVKMGLLPSTGGVGTFEAEATLSLNNSGKYGDRWVYLRGSHGGESDERYDENVCVWTKGMHEVIYLPVAHAEGKFIPRDEDVLRALKKNKQIVFRYTDKGGNSAGYPANPNGSVDDIAGICDPSGRVFGLMPHPERHISYLQHPNWRRHPDHIGEMGVGMKIFENGVAFAQENLLK